MNALASRPVARLRAELPVPGDKSITHRALMLAAVADGECAITGALAGEDCRATRGALAALGVAIADDGDALRVRGAGPEGFAAPPGALDFGNSGTGLRLMSGLLTGRDFDVVLGGDESLSRRPMRRIIEPLRRMGATIDAATGDTPPLRIAAGPRLAGVHWRSPVASAQVKSCLLLAGLRARAPVEVAEPAPSRDHTERMLAFFGARIEARAGVARLAPSALAARDIEIPGDFSSAAFFVVAASIAPDAELLLRGVGVNPTRTGALDILRRMGANIELLNQRETGAEPVADLRVRSARLRGVDIDGPVVANAIDEFPALFVAAACAEGATRLRGAAELRVKESDRIAVMARGLAACGVATQVCADGIDIRGVAQGGAKHGAMRGGTVDAAADHRVAMAFLIAGLAAERGVAVNDCAAIETSFPGFVATAARAGLDVGAP